MLESIITQKLILIIFGLIPGRFEENAMKQPPRPPTLTFFHASELLISMFQGLAITAGLLYIYNYSVTQHLGENVTRAMIFPD